MLSRYDVDCPTKDNFVSACKSNSLGTDLGPFRSKRTAAQAGLRQALRPCGADAQGCHGSTACKSCLHKDCQHSNGQRLPKRWTKGLHDFSKKCPAKRDKTETDVKCAKAAQQAPRGMSKFVDMLVLRKLRNLSTSCWYLMVWSYEGTVMLLCVYISLPYEESHRAERPYKIP